MKERLIKDIQEFVGSGGFVAFEHGYTPTINAWGVSDTQLHLRIPLAGSRTLNLVDLDTTQLTNIILDLFRYFNYCQLYA